MWVKQSPASPADRLETPVSSEARIAYSFQSRAAALAFACLLAYLLWTHKKRVLLLRQQNNFIDSLCFLCFFTQQQTKRRVRVMTFSHGWRTTHTVQIHVKVWILCIRHVWNSKKSNMTGCGEGLTTQYKGRHPQLYQTSHTTIEYIVTSYLAW